MQNFTGTKEVYEAGYAMPLMSFYPLYRFRDEDIRTNDWCEFHKIGFRVNTFDEYYEISVVKIKDVLANKRVS